ncbi:MAG TPA: hypothetical protein VLK89_02415 [Solirubrobacterales bacterium]|nr:hypothetical protein [Solirubrobacterales bacterium]
MGLRNRFGIPGVISVIALVFAMVGGAFAANDQGGSSGSKATASKAGKPGPRGKTGKTGKAGPAGPQGPQGPAGPAGPKGDKGDAGASGSLGTPGTSVTTGPTGPGECQSGGIKVLSASPPAKVCNGTTGFTKTLPSGETETGGFAVNGTEFDLNGEKGSISFNIPLAAPLGATNVHYIDPILETTSDKCTGDNENPTAAKGHLCVYAAAAFDHFMPFEEIQNFGGTAGAAKIGAVLLFKKPAFEFPEEPTEPKPSGYIAGSWAVTAP